MQSFVMSSERHKFQRREQQNKQMKFFFKLFFTWYTPQNQIRIQESVGAGIEKITIANSITITIDFSSTRVK